MPFGQADHALHIQIRGLTQGGFARTGRAGHCDAHPGHALVVVAAAQEDDASCEWTGITRSKIVRGRSYTDGPI